MDHQLIALHLIAFILWFNLTLKIFHGEAPTPFKLLFFFIGGYATLVGIAYFIAGRVSEFV